MMHIPATDAIIEKLLTSFDELKLAEVIELVPAYLSKPIDENEHLAWLDYAEDLHDDFPDLEAVAEVAAIYAIVPGGFTVAETKFEGSMTVNFVKSVESGKCAAMRCKDDSSEIVVIGGRTLPLCARHHTECLHTGQIASAADTRLAVIETAFTPRPDDKAELATETERARANLADIEAFVITTQDEMDMAAAILIEAKERIDTLAERQKKITKPMREAEASVRDLFRPALEAWAKITVIIKNKVLEAKRKQDEQNRLALAVAAEAHAAGEDPTSALAQVVHVENAAGLQTRKVWKFEITDPAAVPREYLLVDERAIRAAGHDVEIPGVRWYEDDSLAVTG